jgi:glutamyl-Q tRNA(Asp) synthetase
MTYITRFAPSPTGYLHLGHAYSALKAYDQARLYKGQFILRIEDIDHTRCRPDFETAIYEDLEWLGVKWDGEVLRQSEHMDTYHQALEGLKAKGLIYADLSTRKHHILANLRAQQTKDKPHKSEINTHNPAWRLSLTKAKACLGTTYQSLGFMDNDNPQRVDPELNGDVVLGRKDIGIAYHLAVVIDDARQGITHIHRGQDLFEATHTHILLQALMGLPHPRYHHHRLLLDNKGEKLAKRKGSKSLRDYRQSGLSPEDIRALIV